MFLGEIVIENRFRGPPECANGGYVGGLLAAKMGGSSAKVKLKRPVPLDKMLQVRESDCQKTQLLDGDTVVAEAEPAVFEVLLPDIPDWSTCEKATETGGAGAGSLFAHCFACGRFHPGGLHVFSGPVPQSHLVAAAWIPRPELGDSDGRLPDEYVWSALDCPGGFALMRSGAEQSMLTGGIAVKIHAPITVGSNYRVLGWSENPVDRWQVAATAIVDDTNSPVAVCRSFWTVPK